MHFCHKSRDWSLSRHCKFRFCSRNCQTQAELDESVQPIRAQYSGQVTQHRRQLFEAESQTTPSPYKEQQAGLKLTAADLNRTLDSALRDDSYWIKTNIWVEKTKFNISHGDCIGGSEPFEPQPEDFQSSDLIND